MRLLPDPQKQGEIQFLFSKKLPYLTRMKYVFWGMVIGVLLQLLVHFWLGLIVLCAANAISLIVGYSARPAVKRDSEQWNQVTPDEFQKIKLKQAAMKQWDSDMFDITNPLGGGLFIGVGVICFVIWVALTVSSSGTLASYWAIDCMVILAPHWMTGIRSYLKKDQLIIKINFLERVMLELASPSDVQVLPMLATREAVEGGRVPMDARLMIRFVNAPAGFLGMQVQISINNVQGKDYPYLYCVLLGKPEFQLIHKQKSILPSRPEGVTVEEDISDGVEVVIVRQYTTRQSGYYTNPRKALYITQTSLDLARKLIRVS